MTAEIMDQIITIISSTFHGNVSLTVQDGRLVQIDRNEKIRPWGLNGAKQETTGPSKGKFDLPAVRMKIAESFEKLEYGQVVIVIKEGRMIQIDRTEKQRFSALVGTYGDGI